MLALYVARTSDREADCFDARIYDGTEQVYSGVGVHEANIARALAYHWPAVRRGGFWSATLPTGRMRPGTPKKES